MRDLYKGRWASFVGNAGVRAIFALDDYETAQYWSQFMGGRLFETINQQQDVYGLTKGQSKGEAMRPLRSPEQLMIEFAKEKMLVLPQGSHPIVSERVPYFGDSDLAGLWDDPRQSGGKLTTERPKSHASPEPPKQAEKTKKAPITRPHTVIPL